MGEAFMSSRLGYFLGCVLFTILIRLAIQPNQIEVNVHLVEGEGYWNLRKEYKSIQNDDFSADQVEEDLPKEKYVAIKDRSSEKHTLRAHDKSSLVFMGKTGTGWTVDTRCIRSPNIKKPLIGYGVGCGKDITWDLEMARRFGFKMFLFDPTKASIAYVQKRIKGNPNVTFIEEGLSTSQGTQFFALPSNPKFVSMREGYFQPGKKVVVKVNTLRNWMEQFGHEHIDILKIDIEGSEYGVLEQLITERYFPFTQLLVEFHERFLDPEDVYRHKKVLEGILDNGFQVAFKSRSAREYTFINMKELENCM
eukprot:CAMPEP_0184509584 /NCGR_PEP_ID=MMETSP0198_2-20121128/1363_1 /TAXON_ID=1112570 /ORGANISM="Thraustochytrium sp., Strain LLF1b" /LENGTH=307 /DNA_ID=CAMNT_0026899427 /DNA_START=121 /DNA_END=1044 /DNA_ORIENTATION=-